MEDLGILSGLVDEVAALMAAGLALTIAFKGSNKWEPVEEDIPNGSVRVAGLLTALGAGILYFLSKRRLSSEFFMWLSINFAVILIIGLFIYVILITVKVYEKEIALDGEVNTIKIIGGFKLTQKAKIDLKEAGTVQRVFRRAAYDEDLVWVPISRAFAKISFLVAYFLFIIGGCLALASGAILLNSLKA